MTESPSWLLDGDIRCMTEMIPCSDRILLATDVYVPGGRASPGPTIVERTPYDRRNPELRAMASFFAGRGYNVVLQDTRGRGDSEGMFQHYIARPHEGEDGAALLDWIIGQPWSDGQVGTTGLSYTGANQQALAIMNHPALKSQVILDAGINYFRRCVREDGAFVFAQLGVYALNMALTSPQARNDPLLRARLDAVRARATDWYARAPWKAGDSPVSALPEYEAWLLHAQDNPSENDTWRNPAMMLEPFIDAYPDIPKLLVTSWYGHHVWSTFLKLDAFRGHRSPTKALVGTWIHTSPYGDSRVSGDADFGPAASLNMNEIRLRWFDATLRGHGSDRVAQVPAVTYFVMGGGAGTRNPANRLDHGGRWAEATRWPPEGGADLRLRLAAEGGLEVEAPQLPGRRRIAVDLDAPVPTIGSSLRNPDIMPGFISSGGVDQVERRDVHRSPGTGLPLSSRADVAAFRTAPFGRRPGLRPVGQDRGRIPAERDVAQRLRAQRGRSLPALRQLDLASWARAGRAGPGRDRADPCREPLHAGTPAAPTGGEFELAALRPQSRSAGALRFLGLVWWRQGVGAAGRGDRLRLIGCPSGSGAPTGGDTGRRMPPCGRGMNGLVEDHLSERTSGICTAEAGQLPHRRRCRAGLHRRGFGQRRHRPDAAGQRHLVQPARLAGA
jgi:putative CocE/NonD family hydrolase